jgi:hypothetical protein
MLHCSAAYVIILRLLIVPQKNMICKTQYNFIVFSFHGKQSEHRKSEAMNVSNSPNECVSQNADSSTW